MTKYLDKINSPADLKKIDSSELDALADELRKFVVNSVSNTGGHLAPNLGAVELTIALHYTFDTPSDKIVWDVGHQAYIHKILTGRKDRFHTLRQYGGISGFPRIDESEFDTFGVGHASTAISAALGMAAARDLKGEDNKVIAVVGDGALTGGIAFEGLNNAGGSKKNFIVILNDNNMSISPNVGALSRYLNQVITNPLYNKIKKDIWDLTGKLPGGAKRVRQIVHRLEESIKGLFVPGMLFERLGFRYFGPIDGHHIHKLIRVFHEIKKLNGPILVHLITTKGKGYKFAEENATKFHGLGSFCPETGVSKSKNAPTYTEVFGKSLVEIADRDKRVVGITAAMADGTGLVHLSKKYPDRFFDVGIAEQHAVTFAAGLALQGYKPVVAIYSTFLQRSFDQVVHDVALQKIPVVFALDRGGLVGEDGPTHHGVLDLSYLRIVPNMVLMAPKDENELRDMLFTAIQYDQGPIALRYPRGAGLGIALSKAYTKIPIGKAEIVREGHDVAVVAIGDMVARANELAKLLEEKDISMQVVNARFVKPLDHDMMTGLFEKFKLVITLENNSIVGGLGGAVCEFFAESKITDVLFHRMGIPDRFITFGDRCDLMKEIRLDMESLAERVSNLYYEAVRGKRSNPSLRVNV